MNCQEMRGVLDAYIDGELDVANILKFERHLAECASCRALYKNYQNVHESVRAQIPYYAVPNGLEERIRANVRPPQATKPGTKWSEALLGWRGWAVTGARTWRWPCWEFFSFRQYAALRTRVVSTTGRVKPCPFVDGQSSRRCGLFRSTHRKALVQRKNRFRSRSDRPCRPGLPLAGRPFGLSK